MRIKVEYKYGVLEDRIFTPCVTVKVTAENNDVDDLEEMKYPFLIKKLSSSRLDGIGVCNLYELQTRPCLEPASEGFFRSDVMEVKISLSSNQQTDSEIDEVKNLFIQNILKGLKALKSQILQPSAVEYYEVV